MNPEGVQLGGTGYEGYPAQPGGPRVIQNNTVKIVTDPPKDHIIWSLCNFVYANPFCLGLVALIYSIKARDRKMVDDLEGAQRHGLTARKFNIAASILVVVFYIVIICIVIANYHAIMQMHRNKSG